jgi:hypothetical protein
MKNLKFRFNLLLLSAIFVTSIGSSKSFCSLPLFGNNDDAARDTPFLKTFFRMFLFHSLRSFRIHHQLHCSALQRAAGAASSGAKALLFSHQPTLAMCRLKNLV